MNFYLSRRIYFYECDVHPQTFQHVVPSSSAGHIGAVEGQVQFAKTLDTSTRTIIEIDKHERT